MIHWCWSNGMIAPVLVILPWKYKMVVRYILWSASKIKAIPFIIFYAIYGAVCFQVTHLSFHDCEYIFTSLWNWKYMYESLAIVEGRVMKQWYASHALLSFHERRVKLISARPEQITCIIFFRCSIRVIRHDLFLNKSILNKTCGSH